MTTPTTRRTIGAPYSEMRYRNADKICAPCLDKDTDVANALAWFALEEVGRALANEREEVAS